MSFLTVKNLLKSNFRCRNFPKYETKAYASGISGLLVLSTVQLQIAVGTDRRFIRDWSRVHLVFYSNSNGLKVPFWRNHVSKAKEWRNEDRRLTCNEN